RDARLRPARSDDGSVVEGDRLRSLVEIVAGLETALRAFGRRNLPLRPFLARAHPETDPKKDPRAGLLPLFHIRGEDQDTWLYTAEDLEAYNQGQSNPAVSDSEPAVADSDLGGSAPPR